VDWIGLLQNNRGLRTWREKKCLTQELYISLALTGRIRRRCYHRN